MNEAAFLAEIRERPDDDAPRLVFGDWLDENGRPEWAEFIRAQIELTRLRVRDPRWASVQKRAEKLERKLTKGWLAALRQGMARQDRPQFYRIDCERGMPAALTLCAWVPGLFSVPTLA